MQMCYKSVRARTLHTDNYRMTYILCTDFPLPLFVLTGKLVQVPTRMSSPYKCAITHFETLCFSSLVLFFNSTSTGLLVNTDGAVKDAQKGEN